MAIAASAVGSLLRTFESLGRAIDPGERDKRRFGPATEALMRQYQAQAALPVTGVFDGATRERVAAQLAEVAPFSVYGRVTDANGDPVAGATVFAVDVDLRRKEVLGETTTDGDGEYEVRYAAGKFTRAEKAAADLVVRALIGDQRVAESTTLFNAPAEVRIDLVSRERQGASEYDRLRAEVQPLLDGAPLSELTDADADFLAGETGRDAEVWRAFVRAQRLAATPIASPGAARARASALPAEAYFALLRAGVPVTADVPGGVRAGALRVALVDAVARNRLPAAVGAQIDEVVARLPDPEAHAARALIGAAVPAETARKLSGRVDALADVSDALLDHLVEAGTIEHADADRVGLAVSLHRLAGPEPAVVIAILDAELPALETGKLRHARELARLAPADWERVLEQAKAPLPDGTTRPAQARRLAIRVAAAYPEDAFRSHAARSAGGPIAGLAAVLERNPDVRFAELDYLPTSLGLAQVDFGDLEPAARAQVVGELRAQQRIEGVTGNAVTAYEVRQAGFTSASAIAMESPTELATKTGVAQAEANAYHEVALALANDAAVQWFGIHDSLRDQLMTPVRVIPSHDQFFRAFDGYRQLLNDQPWCGCEHCSSVLGPAAYFVDLMYYVDQQVLAGSFAGNATHPLHLEQRRPDLWELELTCANTTDLVPTLEIVNEVLARYLRDVVPFADDAALYKQLAASDGSLKQPFTLPLARLTILLDHFRISRFDVATAMHVGPAARARARLGLTLKAYQLITTERIAAPYLLALFRIQSTVTAPDAVIAPIELATLVAALDLPRDTVVAALRAAFVGRDGSTVVAVGVQLGKRDPADVQNNIELVANLTLRRLDRLHRFLRLWRTLPWTIDELDEVLARFAAPAAVAPIAAATSAVPGTLERIVELLELDPAHALSVEELLALTDRFPTRPLREPTALFDRLFDPPAFVARDGAWSGNLAKRFTHPSWTAQLIAGHPPAPVGRSIPADNTLARLLGGLQLSDGELVELVAGLGALPALDHRAASATANESIALTRASLAALYRYARVRRMLGCTIADLLRLVALAGGQLASAADVRAVLELAAWQEASGLTLDQLEYLTDPASAGELDPAAFAADLVAVTAAEHSLELADTLFTRLGLTEAESRDLVAANVAPDPASLLPLEAVAGAYRVRAIGTAGLAIPAALAARVDAGAIRGLLAELAPLHVLDVALGIALRRSLDEVALLRGIADPTTAADAIAIARAIQRSRTAADRQRLIALAARTFRIHALFQAPVFDRAGLQFVADHPAVFFGAGGAASPLDVVRAVAAYRALASATDPGFTTSSEPPDRAALDRVVVGVAAASDADVAAALRTDEARIAALRPHLALPADPFAALAQLQRCLALAERLGVSGETFQRIVAESTPAAAFDSLARAAEDVFGAFRAKYPDERVLRDKLEPFEDKLRERTRDGLVDYLVTRWPAPFAGPDQLYELLLIDVMVQGCARTSRVVAATSSVQLYVHRVLMNLERSADGAVHARFRDPARRAEWAWRKHYRVWEANRRVFLYPENYLEPELRDDKTPLYQELEDALLMQELDKQAVLDIYSRYLSGFDELARLAIAGAFYDAIERKLHLFGVTQDDAPGYYYREVTEVYTMASLQQAPVFSAWHKLALQIPVRKVSPVIYAGRLYVFWVETTTRPINTFSGGASHFGGYRHTLRIKFSTLRLDGAWSAPQLVTFVERDGTSDSRIVEDPRDEARKLALEAQRNAIYADLNNPARQTELAMLRKAATDAAQAAAAATHDRIVAQQLLNAFPTVEEIAGITAAGIFGGPAAAAAVSATMYAGHLAAYGITSLIEREKLDDLQFRRDLRDAKEADARRLQGQIDQLNFQISQLKIYVRWDPSWRDHTEALDSYKPEGWEWERVYPDVVGDTLRLTIVPRNAPRTDSTDAQTATYFRNYPRPLELTASEFVPNPGAVRDRPTTDPVFRLPASRLNWQDGQLQLLSVHAWENALYQGQSFYASTYWLNQRDRPGTTVALAPASASLQSVNGHSASTIVEARGDSVLMRATASGGCAGLRLTTDLVPALAAELWRGGTDALLDATFQGGLAEARSAISPIADQALAGRSSPFHPNNAARGYFRETFFHIPFLVASHLNSQAQFVDAQQWYHYIFDPTAESGDPWRYRELRELPPTTTLREILTDAAALAEYRAHPFSPHAIARTRLTAYQKAIVMRYVDNLLDWGDTLFNQFTMESINEATMLYVMAQDILGPRPAVLAACGEGKVSPKTYRRIRAGMTSVSDFLVELESPPIVQAAPAKRGPIARVVPQELPEGLAPGGGGGLPIGGGVVVGTPVVVHDLQAATGVYWTSTTGTPLGGGGGHDGDVVLGTSLGGGTTYPVVDDGGGGGLGIVPFGEVVHGHTPPTYHFPPVDLVPAKNPAFCIPPNAELLAYWSRVEDRLFKIRNCMDIAGVRRQVELFAPELDPRLLVRMTSAGLSIDDVLNSTSGNLPPYRFAYLIEKARQHTATVQAFGGQLLAAFEKGDAEELAHLRAVHDQNVLQMRSKLAELEIDAAEDALEGLRRQQAAVEYRQQHFASLREVGQIAGERKQQQLQGEASSFRTAAGIAQVVASILTIIPDMGAPTAMKFGGSQLGAAGRAVAEGLNAVAAYNEMAAARAGVEAANQRRDQEWQHQLETAKRELAQIEKSITAAEIRRDIAVRSLAIHEQTVAQSEEMFAFFRDKFSSVDRYRLLSKELRRLYRLAFNSALAMARMAEQAYRAERPGDATVLDGNYWDAETAGLLAGERLVIDLQRLERQFIETNYRELEVEHSFSLAQFAPDELAALRVTGECQLEVPEWFFDLTYPGQYRRRLRAVRLTMPCVTGPHANVGATLRLERSQIRLAAPLNDQPLGPLTTVPLRHTVAIATSKAQGDAGVFDFNFRDERYMPFEGAGAIGTWTLALPKTLRTFDYASISDVILHLAYTAQHDEGLEQRWDGAAAALLALLRTTDPVQPPLVRLVSLRHDQPDAFHRLVSNPPGTEVGFAIEDRHFPSFVAGRDRTIEALAASLQIVTPLRALPGTALSIARRAAAAPQPFKQVSAPAAPDVDGGELCTFELGSVLQTALDPTGVPGAVVGDYVMKLATTADPRRLEDIVLRVGYRVV